MSIACLFGVVGFQNCSPGFKALNTSSVASSNLVISYDLNVTPEQTKALDILRTNCKSCHVDQALGGITNMLSVDHLVRTGLVVVGKPDESKLFIAINNNRMPQGGALLSTDKAAIRNWILVLGNQTAGPLTPVDLGFDIKIPLEPIAFRARLGKLSVLSLSPTDPSLNKAKDDRLFLGDYDFARAILPKYSWEATDMKAWIEAVDPVCSANAMRTRYPWPTGAANFLMATLGRGPNALDNSIVQEINAMNLPATEKFDIFCMSVLASKEYTAK